MVVVTLSSAVHTIVAMVKLATPTGKLITNEVTAMLLIRTLEKLSVNATDSVTELMVGEIVAL